MFTERKWLCYTKDELVNMTSRVQRLLGTWALLLPILNKGRCGGDICIPIHQCCDCLELGMFA